MGSPEDGYRAAKLSFSSAARVWRPEAASMDVGRRRTVAGKTMQNKRIAAHGTGFSLMLNFMGGFGSLVGLLHFHFRVWIIGHETRQEA